MLRQLLGNTRLKVTLNGADLERMRKDKPLGGVRLSQWPTEKMHPFMDKVREILVNSERMDNYGTLDEAPGSVLSVRFTDPGMKDKTVDVPAGAGGLTKVLRAEEKARNRRGRDVALVDAREQEGGSSYSIGAPGSLAGFSFLGGALHRARLQTDVRQQTQAAWGRLDDRRQDPGPRLGPAGRADLRAAQSGQPARGDGAGLATARNKST
jgi:hypothetical protein